MSMRYSQSSFTLIELLIVVAIIGILAAIAIPNFSQAQVKAKVAHALSNMRTIGTGLEAYYLDHNSYSLWATDSNDYKGFCSLTTPVAYITSDSAFINPFRTKHEQQFRLSDGERDPKFELGTWYKESDSRYVIQLPSNIWLLDSSGPDQIDDYHTRNNIATPGLMYHLTNGLLSRGDIFRGGGTSLPSWIQVLSY